MRVNARLDKGYEEKLRFLLEHTGANMTQLIRQAIDLYFSKVKQENPAAQQVLRKNGFVGCASGPRHLAENSKQHLRTILEQKW